MVIYLKDHFGDCLISAETATSVRDSVVEFAKSGDVELSFRGVTIVVLHPLHIIVGTLFSPENIEYIDRIRFIDMTVDQRHTVNRVAQNAVEYYNVPQEVTDRLISRTAGTLV
jgi:hypothetical protein